MHAYFVLHFPKRYRSPCTLRVGFCKALRCGHRNVQLSAHIFQNLLEFFVSGINEIPRNFLALSSFGFWIAHICLSFRFDASDIAFQISSQKGSGLEVVCPLVSLSRTRYIHSVVFSENFVNLVKHLSTYVTILDLDQRSNSRRYFLQHCIQRCTRCPGHVDVFQWNWE